MGKMGRGPGGRIELPRGAVVRDYDEGASFVALGIKYEVSRVTIARRLHEWGATHHDRPARKDVDNGGDSLPLRQQMLQLEEKIAASEYFLERTRRLKQVHEVELVEVKAALTRQGM